MTTKEISTILLSNEGYGDSGAVMCVHRGSPSAAVKVTVTRRRSRQNLSTRRGDEPAVLLVPITDHLLTD